MTTREEGEAGNEDLQHDIQNLLWRMFRADDGPRCQVKNAAPEMGIAPDTLNKYIRGTLPLPAYHVPGLLNATGDRGLLMWIIARCQGITLRELTGHRAVIGTIMESVEDVVIEVGHIFHAMVEGIRADQFDAEEKLKLYSDVLRAQRKLDELLVKLNPELEKDERNRRLA